MHRPRYWQAFVLGLLAIPLAAQRPAPEVLRAQVPSRQLAQGEPLTVGGRACLCARRDAGPFLIWDRTDYLDVPDDERGAAAWLQQHAADLGHGSFTPVFARTSSWNAARVLVFTLQHDGVPLHDAEVWVCFDDVGCLGLVNRVPAGLADPPAAGDAVDPVYKVRRGEGVRDRLVLASRRRSQTATHEIVEFVDGDTVFARERTQRATAAPDSSATFTEFYFGGFPDQIQADARGVIWCSDPTQNRLLEIDPQTGTAIAHSTAPWSQPDGMVVDPRGRVWTGLYTSGHGLGMYDRATGTFTRYAAPNTGANCAIPTWHQDGTIYVTEHSPAVLYRFDLATSTWSPTITLPGTWPVSASYDSSTGEMFVMQWSSNSIARIRNATVANNYPTPVLTGPSFSATANGKVWFSYWSSTQIGELDATTGAFMTHNQAIGGQGGPIDVGPNGHVYLGTRNTGYIIEFDPVSGTSTNHPIPSSSWQLKDGLTVAPDGTVWFTSSNNGRVVRLTLP